jgi:hypothetical protein
MDNLPNAKEPSKVVPDHGVVLSSSMFLQELKKMDDDMKQLELQLDVYKQAQYDSSRDEKAKHRPVCKLGYCSVLT